MKVQIFGVGSAAPVLDKHPSAQVVKTDQNYFLIDCGEGTQYRLLEHKIKHTKIGHVFISHLHGDHYLGLIGLISSLNLNGRKEPLSIYGPKGLDEIITIQLKYSASRIQFPLKFIAANTTENTLIYEDQQIEVETIPLKHRIPCCGYLFKQKPSAPKIKTELLPPHFPVDLIKKLKKQHDVVFEQKEYSWKKHTTKSIGTSYAYCSDSIYMPELATLLKNVDLLYHEATFANQHLDRAKETFHTTAEQAASLAKASNAKRLIIGHFSSRYKSLDVLLEEAKAVFIHTELATEGSIYQV